MSETTKVYCIKRDRKEIPEETHATHIKALTETVDEILSQAGEPPLRREGHRSGTWVLLDFAAVIVHIFTEEAREFYDLERLWSDSEEIDLSQFLTEDHA